MKTSSQYSPYHVVHQVGDCRLLQVKPWASVRVDLCLHRTGLLLGLPLDRRIFIYAPCCLEKLHRVIHSYGYSPSSRNIDLVCHCGRLTHKKTPQRLEQYTSINDSRIICWLEDYNQDLLQSQLDHIHLVDNVNQMFQWRKDSLHSMAKLCSNVRDTFASSRRFNERHGNA